MKTPRHKIIAWFLESSNADITEVMAEIVQEVSMSGEDQYKAFVESVHCGLDQV